MNWKVRFKNPVFWGMVAVTIISTALSYNSMNPQDLTTWGGLFNLLKGVVLNPYLLFTCICAVAAAAVDPTTKGLKDSKRALDYDKPNEY